MSIQRIYPETRTDPAEYVYTSPAECVVCGEEHDLDDDTGRSIVEGLPWGDGVICDTCHLCCSECGEVNVLELQSYGSYAVAADIIWYDNKPYCAFCFARALTGVEP